MATSSTTVAGRRLRVAAGLALPLAAAIAACHGAPAAVTASPAPLTGFVHPESVVWDPSADVYLVSDFGPEPFAADGDGVISRVGPDGTRLAPLVEGAPLDSPRGLALRGDQLFVADLQHVRAFDRRTGAPRGAWRIEGAVLLNDVVIAGERVCVSDSGLPPDRQPAGARHAIYCFDPDATDAHPSAIVSAADLGRPNGLVWHDGELWVASVAGRLCHVGDGVLDRCASLPATGLDGIVVLADGRFAITSWEPAAIFVGRPGGPWHALSDRSGTAAAVTSPADHALDTRRHRLVVPLLIPGQLAFVPL